MRRAAVAFLLVAAFLVNGCGDDLPSGDTVPPCPVPVAECGYYPEAGDTIAPCVGADGQQLRHGELLCVLGHNRNDTPGLDCNFNCGGGVGCQISRDRLWAVADCGACQ